ncbi:MAG: hypothetical protein WD883_00545 [Candidatus Colwellbacteria bacterium]
MDKKVENNNDKPILSKAGIILILIIAAVPLCVSIFNVYSDIHRQLICNEMATFNAQVAPADMYSYILRKEAFENICLERSPFGSYISLLVSLWFLFWFPIRATMFFSKQEGKQSSKLF